MTQAEKQTLPAEPRAARFAEISVVHLGQMNGEVHLNFVEVESIVYSQTSDGQYELKRFLIPIYSVQLVKGAGNTFAISSISQGNEIKSSLDSR